MIICHQGLNLQCVHRGVVNINLHVHVSIQQTLLQYGINTSLVSQVTCHWIVFLSWHDHLLVVIPLLFSWSATIYHDSYCNNKYFVTPLEPFVSPNSRPNSALRMYRLSLAFMKKIQSNLSIRTPLLYRQFPTLYVPTKFSQNASKNTSVPCI